MPKFPKITNLLFFLQYIKKELGDEFDFLQAEKRKRFLQINTMISW